VIQSEEILIEKQERDKIRNEIDHLKTKIEVQVEMDKKLKKINELEHEIENKEIDNSKRYHQLEDTTRQMERMNQDRISQMIQAHNIEMERRKQDYRDKQEADHQRLQELQASKDQDTRKFEERANELTLHHEKIIKELKQDQKIQIERQKQETSRLKAKIDEMNKKHQEERERIENDTWEKIDILKDKNKDEMAKIIDIGMQSKCDQALIHNDYNKKKAERDQHETTILNKNQLLTDYFKSTSNLKQQIQSQMGELAERDTTIKDKDKRIIDLRKKTQELEKFKFVLDYKIKELKKDIGPKEVEIQKLNEQTNKMRQELKHFMKVTSNLNLIVDDLRMRQEGLTNELKNLQLNLDQQEAYKKKFKDDVFECMHHIFDFKKLKSGVIRLHKKYVLEELKNEAGDTDLHREYANKRRYLENNVICLRTMLQKEQDVHTKENKKIMSENVYLLQEINVQKKELHSLLQKIKENKKKIDEMQVNGGMPIDSELLKDIKMVDMDIEDLTAQIQDIEERNDMMRQQMDQMGQFNNQDMYNNNYPDMDHSHHPDMDDPH
jgi:hypothetical protein